MQEAGVDEPDIVKSKDGTVFAVVDDALRSIDARSPVPRVRDVVHLPGYGGELLIAGNRALAISSGDSGDTVLSELNIADPEHLRIVRTLSIDGLYVSARLHGHTARVVISSYPRALRVPVVDLPRPAPIPIDASAAAGKPLRARRAGWVPSATLRNRRTGRTRKRALVACDDVRRTPRFTGADMLSVLTVDLPRAPGGRRRRGDDQRRHRLRVADEPLRRHQRRLGAQRHLDPPLRPRRRRPHGLPRQRAGAGRPAQPVLDVGVQGRAAGGDHRLVGRARARAS